MAQAITYEVRLDEFADAEIVDMLRGEADAAESIARLVRIGWQRDRLLRSFERTSDLVRSHLLRQVESIARGEPSPPRAWKGTHDAIDAELVRMRDGGASPAELARASALHGKADSIVEMCAEPEGVARARDILTG